MSAPIEAQDKRINRLGWATFGLVAFVALLAIIAVPVLLSTSSSVSATNEGNQLAACRSRARGPVDDAKASIDLATNEGLEAIATGDDVRRDEIVATLPALRGQYRQALDTYQRQIADSTTDPGGFLARCQNGG